MSEIFRSQAGAVAVSESYEKILEHWPVPHERRYIETGQGTTHVIVSGAETGLPLVLLHGSSSSSYRWMGEIPLWSRLFRVFAVDVIGEPGLSAPSRPPLPTAAHSEWLDDVLAGLGIADVSLVGESFGGWIALDYAVREAQNVRRLVLMCPGGIGPVRPSFMFKALPLLLLGPFGLKPLLRLALGRLGAELPPGIAEFVQLTFRHFRGRRGMLPLKTDAELARLGMPVLLIMGDEDAIIDAQKTRARLAANAPDVEVVMLPGVGHLLPSQAERIAEFVGRSGELKETRE